MNGRDAERLEELSDTELQELLLSLGPEMTWVVGEYNRHTTIAMLTLYLKMQKEHQVTGNLNSAASGQSVSGEVSARVERKKGRGKS